MALGRLLYSLVNLCLLLVFVSGSISYQFHTKPADVAVSSSGQLYIVAGKKLYLLQSNLSLQQSITLTAKDTTANKVVLSLDETTLIACLRDGTCFIYAVEDHSLTFQYGVNAAIANEGVAVAEGGIIPNQFYFGSSGYINPGENHVILLKAYDFFWGEEMRSSENFIVTNSSFVSRDFYHAFKYSSYIYYIVIDTATNLSLSGIKVLRVCDDVNDTSFSAMFEVELRCSNMEQNTIIANSVQIVEGYRGTRGVTILIGFRSENGHKVCSFDISDVDTAIENVFQECIDGIHKIPLPWVDYSLIADCSFFSEVRDICTGNL